MAFAAFGHGGGGGSAPAAAPTKKSKVALFLLLPGEGLMYRLLMLAGFSIMCGVWILTILLSGMKRYKAITVLFGSLGDVTGIPLAVMALAATF